ncbi:MAG: hypothetical protein ACRCVN_06080 [Spirochaetia bacterium]
MSSRYSKYLLFLISGLFLSAYQWPNPAGRVRSHFGQFLVHGVSRTITFGGEFEEIFPVTEGTIIFEHSVADSIFPTKNGTTIVMDRNDGITIVYGGISTPVAYSIGQNFNLKQSIGSKSLSGKLDVAFYDIQTSQYVNPLLFLPTAVREEDKRAVVLSALYLRNAQGQQYVIQSGMNYLPAGTYEVFADVKEIINGSPLAPYQIDFDFMGDILTQITLDALTANEGKGILKGKKVYQEEDLYDARGRFRIGRLTLTPGQSFMTLRLSSINALRRQEQFRIMTTTNN